MRQRNVKNKQEIMNNSNYYIQNPQKFRGKWQTFFNNDNPIYIEIGMGKGQFIIKNAICNPNINFIGVEKQDSILALALKKIPDNLNNLVMLRLDANSIDEVFSKEINKLYLNFSDPWPKKRHEKRRLTSPLFLEKYESIFKKRNEIELKTDNVDLFCYSIKSLNNNGYFIEDITFDLAKRNDLNNIKTEYEEKFTKLNKPIYKIKVSKEKNKKNTISF